MNSANLEQERLYNDTNEMFPAYKSIDCPDSDDILKGLIKAVEKENISINITLNIKGTVVSGEIISKKEYCERLIQYLISKHSDLKLSIDTEKLCSRFNFSPKDVYIHLKNAKIYFSLMDSAPIDEGVLWRGKLCSVDGFIPGDFRSYP